MAVTFADVKIYYDVSPQEGHTINPKNIDI